MNAIIHNFQNELSAAERRAFADRARLSGRRPGAHLKAILFGESPERTAHGAAREGHGADHRAQSVAQAGAGERKAGASEPNRSAQAAPRV